MKFWTRLVLMMLIVGLLAACGGSEAGSTDPTERPRATTAKEPTAEAEKPTTKPTRKPTEASAEPTPDNGGETGSTDDWEQYNFEEEGQGFTVMMPSKPEESTQQVETDIGTVDLYIFQATEGDNVFMVSYTDYPPEKIAGADPDEMLDGAVNGQVQRFNGTLEDSDKTELRGYPGRLVMITIPNLGTAFGALYLVENRLYQNLALMPGEPDENLAEEFVESFDLIGTSSGGEDDLLAGWEDFESEEGNFKTSFPGTPEESTQPVETEIGSVDLYLYQVAQQTAVYMVSYTDYPKAMVDPANADKMLDGAVNGQVQRFKGTLERSDEVDQQGHPGRYVEITIPNLGVAYGELYLVNNRLYQNLVLLQKPSSDEEILAAYFLESFELLEP